jgi:hypothetical protein
MYTAVHVLPPENSYLHCQIMKNAREKNCTGQEGFSGIYRAMYHVAASAYICNKRVRARMTQQAQVCIESFLANIYQNCSVIKTAAAKTNATRKTRQAHKASDPERSAGVTGVDVECSSISWGGDAGSSTVAAEAMTAD